MIHNPCTNCGYSMRHIKTGNKWVCDSCCNVQEAEPIILPAEVEYLSDDAMDNNDDNLTYVQTRGRILHGTEFNHEHRALTTDHERRLVELELEIAKAVLNYRAEEPVALLRRNLAPYKTDTSRPLGY